MTLVGIAGSVAAVLFSAIGVPLLLWTFFRFVARRAEQRVLTQPPAVVGEPGRVTPILLGCAVAGPLIPVLGLLSGRGVALAVALTGFVAMVSAWVVHGLPGHSRNWKYALYYLGSAGLGLAFAGGRPFATMIGIGFAIGMAHLVVAALCLLLLRPDAPLKPGDASSRRAFRLYRAVTWIQGPDLPSILVLSVLSVVQLGIPYLFIRWCVGARVGRRAVLYLRSFHDEDAGRVFGRVIAPALHRSVAVAGLVHRHQPTRALNSDVPLLWRSRFVAVADENWREWVERHLRSALAVVVDVSIATDSLAWELERARALLPPERLIVLRRATVPAPLGLPTVAYDLGAPGGIDLTRSEVSGWLGRALDAVDSSLARTRPRVSPPRWQLPVPVLLVLGTGLPLTGLVVIAVMLLVQAQLDGTRHKMTMMSLSQMRHAAAMEVMETGTCPTYDDLVSKRLLDGRGNSELTAIRIECGDEIVVRAAGPDGRFGTADDLSTEH